MQKMACASMAEGTFSSELSRSFLRKDSTQSRKHFSTSELYIRRLQGGGNSGRQSAATCHGHCHCHSAIALRPYRPYLAGLTTTRTCTAPWDGIGPSNMSNRL